MKSNTSSKEQDMPERPGQQLAAEVAACTTAAVHRRDHHHTATPECHPHAVEVVHLGHRAVTVCHDCEADSGFLPEREAEAIARTHREQTMGEGNASFSAVA